MGLNIFSPTRMMNITKENNGDLGAVIKVKLGPEDYKEKYETALKDVQKKVNMPGFRPGKVPVGMVKKMYGKSILADEINKILSDSVHKYIVDNKLDVLGSPLPKDDTTPIDWDNQTEFEFSYELGLAPSFKLDFSSKDKFTRLKLKIDEKLTDKWINDIQKRYGQWTSPEVSEENDYIFADMVELDDSGNVKEGGVFKQSANILTEKIKDTSTRKALTGLKKEDQLEIDPSKLAENTAELASILGIEKNATTSISKKFRLTVKNIGRMKPAQVDQDLFDKVYGKDVIKSKDEFIEKIKSELSKLYGDDTQLKLKDDIRKAFIEKLKISLPDDFLKRWLMAASEKPITLDDVNKEYDRYALSLKWELIQNKIIKENDIKVSGEEVKEQAKSIMASQFARYGQPADDSVLEETVNKLLANKEESRKIFDRVYEQKVFDVIQKSINITDKEVPYEEFYTNH